MNKKLNFSWAHIIAFVAIIFYAYITFVGATYLFNCKFWLSGLVTFVLVAIIFFLFIGVQQIKGADEKFSKAIVWERILMVCTVLFYCASLHPFLHTWHVKNNQNAIETQFSSSIKASKQLFVEYEKYTEDRIANYSNMMDEIIKSRNDCVKFGFVTGREEKQKELRLQTLRLQLLSSNYDQLKEKACNWIESADTKASIWNIFLIGNIDQIKSAVTEWESQLQSDSFSGKVLKDEEFEGKNVVSKYDKENKYLEGTINGLDNLRSQFTMTGVPSKWGYLIALVCYFALILPYFIQPRSTKNWHRLFGYAGWYKPKNNILHDESNEDKVVKQSIKRDQMTRKKKDKEYDDGQIHFEGIENI